MGQTLCFYPSFSLVSEVALVYSQFQSEQNKQAGLQFSLLFPALPFLSKIKEEAGRREDCAWTNRMHNDFPFDPPPYTF